MKDSIVKKNLDLLDEFMKCAFDHPNILDDMPQDRSLVILPDGDPALERENRKTLRALKSRKQETVVIKLRAIKRKVSRVG